MGRFVNVISNYFIEEIKKGGHPLLTKVCAKVVNRFYRTKPAQDQCEQLKKSADTSPRRYVLSV